MKSNPAPTLISRWFHSYLAAGFAACVAAASPLAAEQMISISWTEGPEYPMGIQDSACGVVNGLFISAGGFSRHPMDILQQHPDAFGGAASGFTNLVFGIDVARPSNGWTRLPDLPGPARQAAAAVAVGNALYVVGGFNYSAPYTYRSTYRLQHGPDGWVWTDLQCEVPWPVCEANAIAIGPLIYLIGGADYFRPSGTKGAENFYTEAGRDNSPVGRALLVLDTRDPAAGWKRLADFPGVPRAFSSAAAAGGKLYVLAGLYSPLPTPSRPEAEFYNAVDSWVYDPAKDSWSRLPDMPDDANVRAVSFNDRYLLLLGGYKYGTTWLPDGRTREVYTEAEKASTMAAKIKRSVMVYDTLTRTLAEAAPLLDQSSWPMATVHGFTVFCLGGEGGARLWHPATFQIGRIQDNEPLPDWPED